MGRIDLISLKIMKNSKKSSLNSKILVSTFNCRTLSNDAYLSEFKNAIKKINYDIIGLAETKRNGEGTIDCKDFLFYYHGKTTRSKTPNDEKAASVGFVIKEKWKNNIAMLKSISYRVCILILKINDKDNLGIIQVYAPTSSANQNEIDTFYDNVEKAQSEIAKCKWKIIMGDWNSKIGERLPQECDVMGFHTFGRRNERGERLIRFCRKNQLSIVNSMFNRKVQNKWTWSLDNITKNEIDFILTPQKCCVKNLKVLNKFEFESDHRLVRMTFELNTKIVRYRNFKKKNPLRMCFDDPHTVMKFNESLKHKLKSLTSQMNKDPIESLEAFKHCTFDAANSVQYKTSTHKVITEATKEKIRERELLRKEAQKDPTVKKDYYDFRRQVKKEIRYDVRNYELHRIDEAIRNNKCLKIARNGIFQNSRSIKSLKDDTGICHSDPKEIESIAVRFFSNLYSSKSSENFPDEIYDDDGDVKPISMDELKDALSRMKRNKSRGPDDFPIDLLKVCDESNLKILLESFNCVLSSEKLPEDWLKSEIVLIFKKGKKDEIKNYRPISLIPHLYKLFVQVILMRIDPLLDEHQPENQAGFRRDYSTSDNLFVINQLIEKSKEFQKDLCIAFIDFEKAFDTIEPTSLIRCLEDFKIPRKYIRIIKNIYEGSTTSIKLDITSKSFNCTRGVKQGDPMSPKLFNAVLENIFRKLNWSRYGIEIKKDLRLNNLRFADDVTLFSESKTELLTMIKELKEESERVGLLINAEKTKIISNKDETFKVDDWCIEKVNEMKYLGQNISFNMGMETEINIRIAAAWRSFWALKKFLKSNLPMAHKRKLMDSVILPVFTYGAQTWTLSLNLGKKLQTEQKAMERTILRISLRQHKTNEEIRGITGLKDVLTKARELKWDFAGHVLRMNDTRLPKLVCNWTPLDGKRKSGHQLKRWSDDIEKVGLGRWKEKSQDRTLWLNLRETYVLMD